ncbi:family 3 adenylate cyclase (plasmid) [Desulfosporosinus acidiphilus SJ4]|uniref:Family 3 adenylate cyclase n=1 Tax=Desulfosporosinus acidiphilus (strain DSM 22704 / JCM 16185 / SJ4) TaxID=646529 RepID=I4DCR2_DESAJ|nr:family 3 adenylate cyclase [Desulfosporosinus acidiphilus]AFM43586.1 family 3 adenylate cyclase [Desulfosporosinus acidiphilus SJ4]
MLSERLKQELNDIVNRILDRCELQWDNTLGKNELIKALLETYAMDTNIPGHPFLGESEYKSDVFVAFMLDMRDSTKHLRQAISARIASVSEMQRVFYEVSALLPAMTKIIREYKGSVTEYLGDGLLALFQLPKQKEEQAEVLHNVINAANTCLEALNQVVNPILNERFGLPKIEIGIGLAFSDAIISHFGLPPHTQVKVIGECIYFASKCSKGRNEIILHEYLKHIWPKSKKGQLRFTKRSFDKFDGYIVTKKSEIERNVG